MKLTVRMNVMGGKVKRQQTKKRDLLMSGGAAACEEAEGRITSHLRIVLIAVFVGADD